MALAPQEVKSGRLPPSEARQLNGCRFARGKYAEKSREMQRFNQHLHSENLTRYVTVSFVYNLTLSSSVHPIRQIISAFAVVGVLPEFCIRFGIGHKPDSVELVFRNIQPLFAVHNQE